MTGNLYKQNAENMNEINNEYISKHISDILTTEYPSTEIAIAVCVGILSVPIIICYIIAKANGDI